MSARLPLVLALAGTLLGAQTLVDRPEKLTFPPLSFTAPRAKEHKARLRNGIPVYLAPAGREGTPLVRVTVHWRGGAHLVPAGRAGLAQVFGSQLVQGGTTRLQPAQLEDRLEALAASLSGSCGDTSGALALQILDRDLAEGLDLLLQSLTQPAFAQDRLDLARRQAGQGLARRNDAVTSIATYQMGYLLNGESHFSTQDPTAASLAALTREDLLAFHARLLHPQNLVVSVSGRFERKALLEALDRTLGALKPGAAAQVSPKPPAPDFQRKPGILVSDKEAPQASLQWALPGLRRTDPDWHAALVMNQILGAGGFTSRLMKRIRSDEGLTYGVRTALGPGPHWRGDLTGGLQTKNRSVAFALRLVLEEMRKLKEAPVGPEELRVIKEGLVESFPSQWAGHQVLAARFAEEALTGWPEDWWADFRERIRAVTAADVQRLALRLLDPSKMVVLAVGRAGEIEAGDPDHPGRLAEALPLPLSRLPLRDPLTLQPQP